MLAKRIIPCLDVKDNTVVKGINFLSLDNVGDPVQLAKYYAEEGADEIVFLDITASSDERNIMRNVVQKVAESVFVPLTVGGGMRSTEDVYSILHAGADKVSLNTSAVNNPSLIKQVAKRFGSQCTIVAIDAKRETSSKCCVYTHGGRNKTDLDVIEWAKKVEDLGAGEILLTSMDADGTKKGYDLELTQAVVNSVSGGVGELAHLYQGLVEANASAVLAASIFHYGNVTIPQAKQYLKQQGVCIR